MASSSKRHSIIFIRENEGQLTGSDCCGKLEGDWRSENGQPVFKEQRQILAKVAPLFLAVKNKYENEFEIIQVDPRNQFFLFPKILGQILLRKDFSRAAFRSLLMVYRLPAILINGSVKYSGQLPDESELLLQLDDLLNQEMN